MELLSGRAPPAGDPWVPGKTEAMKLQECSKLYR